MFQKNITETIKMFYIEHIMEPFKNYLNDNFIEIKGYKSISIFKFLWMVSSLSNLNTCDNTIQIFLVGKKKVGVFIFQFTFNMNTFGTV